MPKVLLFGAFSDRAGWSERTLAPIRLSVLRDLIAAEHPALAEPLAHRSTMVIVNHDILPQAARIADPMLGDEDEVAFGPPVSGG